MSEPFPADVLQEIDTMAPGVIADFGSVDFLGEPWAWVILVARDMPERSQYLRESGAPGPYMVDFREAFQHHWGTDASAKLMKVLVSLVENHFSMVAQGLHRRPGYYVTRMRALVQQARTVLDPIFVAHLPEEHGKNFLAARLVETTTAVPASARQCALAIMRVRPSPAVRPGADKPAEKTSKEVTVSATSKNDQPLMTTSTGNRLGSKERKRQEAARARLLSAQNLGGAASLPTAGRATRDRVQSVGRQPTPASPPPSRPSSRARPSHEPQPRVGAPSQGGAEDLSLRVRVPPAAIPANDVVVPRAQKAAEAKVRHAAAAEEKAANKVSLARRSRSKSEKTARAGRSKAKVYRRR
jgi:hypothetical protein